jgi:hypothetical protein
VTTLIGESVANKRCTENVWFGFYLKSVCNKLIVWRKKGLIRTKALQTIGGHGDGGGDARTERWTV